MANNCPHPEGSRNIHSGRSECQRIRMRPALPERALRPTIRYPTQRRGQDGVRVMSTLRPLQPVDLVFRSHLQIFA